MDLKKTLLLGVAILLIIGAIVYLESGKVSPGSSSAGVDEIRIEDQFALETDQTGEAGADNNQSEPTMTEGNNESDEVMTAKDSESTEEKKTVISKTRAEIIAEKAEKFERAKEITTPDGYINVDSINIRDLIGKKVILLDIWTYSCINCQRTTPYLNSWYEKYEDDGLVIIGLHTPEFEFEKEYDNVAKATEALGIKFPVVMDNDYSTWHAYKNRYWPRKYLIDIDGFIVYDHIGEGAYDETEDKIVAALNERSQVLGGTAVVKESSGPTAVDEVDFSKIGTRETYLGSDRMEFLANPKVNCVNKECEYKVPETIPDNLFAFDGSWSIQSEHSDLKSNGGSLFSNFYANKMNLVAGSDKPIQAEIYLDGELITDEFAGADVKNGIVTFQEHTLYNLIDLKGDYSRHTVEIRFLDSDISVFAFTFG